MRYWILWTVALSMIAQMAHAGKWYVSPNGVRSAVGTRQAPWDMASALNGAQKVAPGDTIYLMAGTYKRRPDEQYVVKLVGDATAPIIIRPEPGTRVIIDGGLDMQDPSAYVWVRDLEILVSEPTPDKPVSPGSSPAGFTRPWGGLNMHGGHDCKFINLVVHNCRQGISFWQGARDCEIYGCIIYDNGWPGTDRGHGHAIYTQNRDGVKTISDCIMTGGYGYTMHAYGSKQAFIDNYVVEGNICYDAGLFLIGGGSPSHGIHVRRNYLYNVGMQLGYGADNDDCEVRGNVIVNDTLSINKFARVDEGDNTELARDAARPKGSKVVLRTNRYDANRANLAIFNWGKAAACIIDVSSFLKRGDSYRLYNPREVFGKPVLSGSWSGKPISVPMRGEFAAYVMMRSAK